jgi:tol-pal system-associated acyl-CoA thioesterase
MAAEFFLPLRVYIEDTDAGGIVYYVNYLKFMERARTEWMRQLGYGKTALFETEANAAPAMFVVVSSHVHYLGSAVLDDELTVSARPLQVKRASIVFEQEVRRETEVLCRGEIRIACVNRETRQPQAMPETMYTRVSQVLN